MLLDGKSAIITGSGSGVGRASALHFAKEGAKVVVADVNDDNIKETVSLVEAAGGTAIGQHCDVSNEDEVKAMIAAAVDAFGRLDVLFNNVGIPTPRLGAQLADHTWEDFRRLNDVNFGGVFNGCKFATLQFKEQGTGGAIVNTGSVAGLVAWGGSVYGATKGAVHQLTRAVAIEGAPFGIRCNAICPAGMPYTGFMQAGGMPELPADKLDEIAATLGQQHPLGQPITAEDCAHAAAFLASDRASNITGVLLPVDGGFVAK